MKKLTIAIPTYNRAGLLSNTLHSLLNQNECLSDISIYISDNDSTDDTNIVVNEIIKNNPDVEIVYSKNNSNLGFDENVYKCFSECTTEYVWILSDDDSLFEYSIKDVLDATKEGSDIICLNDKTANGLSLKPTDTIIEVNASDEDERWNVISKFVWISRFVCKKYSPNKKIMSDYIGTGLIHLAILNQVLLNQEKPFFFITSTNPIHNNPHCVFSHNFADVFVNKIYDFLMIPESNFSKRLALKVASENIPFIVNGLLRHKIGSAIFKYDFKTLYLINKMIKYKCNIGLIVKFILIKLIPSSILRKIIKVENPCFENQSKVTNI